MDEWLGRRRVELRGADLDEAPQAYRRLPEVLEAQGETVRVNHTLRPIGVAMAGPRDWDPYKD
jgi:tRNA-splicing ligase RtcB